MMQSEKTRMLITGATGNVGLEVIQALHNSEKAAGNIEILAGVRNIEKSRNIIKNASVQLIPFDFEDHTTFDAALKTCDVLFLLRPPQISNVKKHFRPLIEVAQSHNVKHITFLSVQGAEKNSVIPHHKIEQLILDTSIPYTFLRPAYFMQNFTTTLHDDLVKRQRIFLPAGNAKFNLIDVRDIGKAAAVVLDNYQQHQYKAYTLTGEENLSFQEMANVLSEELNSKITYISPNLFSFFLAKRKEGVPSPMILVMIMLHFLPRFQSPPPISKDFEALTHMQPRTFSTFVQDHREILQVPDHQKSKS